MHRGGYDQIPNRIISHQASILDVPGRRHEYEVPRAGRAPLLGPPPISRQPLLGDAPVDRFSYPRPPIPYPTTYDEPVFDIPRRGGFDKGPQGEDLIPRMSARQPLLRTPKLAVERIGGDMDISRSRSASPEYRLINARDVRDDRKKDRDDRKKERDRPRRSRSRSRSRRSRSRSRTRRSRSRSRSRDRNLSRDRGNTRDREKERVPYEAPNNDQVREGIVWTNENYYDFLNIFIKLLSEQGSRTGTHHSVGRLYENITKANEAEKERLVLPPEYRHSDRERMLHCDTTIEGLPASIFFGSGYGTRQHYAKFSAGKDLIDKCHRIGVINSELHAAIGDRPKVDKTFEQQYSSQISKAVNAVILLMKKMSHEVLPIGFMTLRHLDPEIIDRFKILLRMVMIDVYYQGIESAVAVVPKDLETGYNSRSRDSHSGSPFDSRRNEKAQASSSTTENGYYGSNAEEVLAEKERQLKLRMEQELENKKRELEQEIRRKVLEEERAKIRAELEMEKKIEQMMRQQQQFELEKKKEKEAREEQQKKLLMTQQVEEDFYALVEKLEQQFVEIRARGLNHVLEMIYASSTFKTIQLYSSTLTSMTFEQKQKLVVDLKSLLESIAKSTQSTPVQGGSGQVPFQSGYGAAQPSRNDQVRILQVGDMRLRALSQSERRRLSKGDKVITQDMKDGNWNLAVVLKVEGDRVVVAVGNGQWKKQLDELYIEDNNSRHFRS